MGYQEPVNPHVEKLHRDAQEMREKQAYLKQQKDMEEIEQAYLMSQKPIQKKISKNRSIDNYGVRTLDRFMEDQIMYEQKRYENLKNAIMREEAEEMQLFQPQITKKSLEIVQSKGNLSMTSSSRKFQRQQKYINEIESQYSYHPNISKMSKQIKRNKDELFLDAQRR